MSLNKVSTLSKYCAKQGLGLSSNGGIATASKHHLWTIPRSRLKQVKDHTNLENKDGDANWKHDQLSNKIDANARELGNRIEKNLESIDNLGKKIDHYIFYAKLTAYSRLAVFVVGPTLYVISRQMIS